jgi:dephospho-CoA kinase
MRLIGLTGNIAAGKSSVARLFAGWGATIIDADVLAREAVAPGTPALAAIAERWGAHLLQDDGTLDRAALRRIVFASPDERAALGAIVHPAVAALRDRAIEAARAAGAEVVVCDVPLLFEAGLEHTVQDVVLVDAPPETRLERLMRDRGLWADEARAMMEAQWPSGRKRGRARWIIDNVGTPEELTARARTVFDEIRRTTPSP